MTNQMQQREYSFVLGLLAGTVVGVGLAMLLAPGAAREVGNRLAGSAEAAGNELGRLGSELGRRSDAALDQVTDAVARGARDVERFATDGNTAARS